MIEITLTGDTRLAHVLERFPGELHKNLRKAVEVSAKNVKDGARQRVIPSKYLPHLPRAIRYRFLRSTRDVVEASVHAEGRQARLIGVIEHGSPTSGPHPFLGPAGRAEWAGFRNGCREAIIGALRQASNG
jgi:hypothetical protein